MKVLVLGVHQSSGSRWVGLVERVDGLDPEVIMMHKRTSTCRKKLKELDLAFKVILLLDIRPQVNDDHVGCHNQMKRDDSGLTAVDA